MTATDFVGSVIDGLLERRYGALFSPKWWAREHEAHLRGAWLDLACPYCPSAEELAAQMRRGAVLPPMSGNDARAIAEALG